MNGLADRGRLPRQLGAFSAIAVLVGTTIGSGIFRAPAVVASDIHQLWPYILAWVVGGLVALAGALSFAELGARFPRSGGTYVYIREAFGKLPAFLFGWAELFIIRPAAYGAIALIPAEHSWRLLGLDGDRPLWAPIDGWNVSWAQGLAIGFIITVAAVNYRGIKLGAMLQNLSTVLKVGAIGLLIGLGLLLVPDALPSVAAAPVPTANTPAAGGMAAFGLGMVAVLWAYDGWSDVGFVGGEIRDPGKNIPMAFIAGTAIVVSLYLLLNLVYLRVVPLANMAGRPLIAADVAAALIGPTGAVLVSATVAVSTFGTLNGAMMTGPRVVFAMAGDGFLLHRLARVHPHYATPGGAIVLSMVLGVGFVSVRGFAQLASQFIIGIWPFYALAVAAVFVLRKRKQHDENAYRTWGYPVVPLLFLAAAVFLLGNYALREPFTVLLNVGVVLTGVPVYWIQQRRGAHAAARARG